MHKLTSLLNIKNNKIFCKILLYFLSLLIPIIIVGVSTYFYYINIMKQDFQNKINMNLNLSISRLEDSINLVQEVGRNFFNDKNIQSLLKPKYLYSLSDKTQLAEIPKIMSRDFIVARQFIDSYFVYIDNENIYTGEGISDYDMFFNLFYRYEKYDPGFWANILQTRDHVKILPVSGVTEKGKDYTKHVIPIIVIGRVNAYNTVAVFNISTDTIYKMLKSNAIFPTTSFIITDRYNNVITLGDDDNIKTEAANIIAFLTRNGRENDEVNLNGEKYISSYLESDIFKCGYYAITPVNEFSKHTAGILTMTILICIILIIISIIFSFIFSVRLYSPIKNIRDIVIEKYSSLGYEMKHGPRVNEFELIKDGIDWMADSQSEYKNKASKYFEGYLEYSFFFLIKGDLIDKEDMFKERFAEIGFNKEYFACCNILFEFTDSFYNTLQDVDRPYITGSIKDIIWHMMGKYLKTYVIEYKQNYYVCILNLAGQEDRVILDKALNDLIQTFNYDTNYYNISIGIGGIYQGLNNIVVSYNEACAAINNRKDKISNNNECRFGTLVTLIMNYIEENYDKDLYLEKIADEMGLSPKYISRIFKEKTGINLSHYINALRVEKAKELMTKTNMKINDICYKVGIENRTTFLRIFKDIEGVNPSEYRKRYRKSV